MNSSFFCVCVIHPAHFRCQHYKYNLDRSISFGAMINTHCICELFRNMCFLEQKHVFVQNEDAHNTVILFPGTIKP